MKSNYEIVLVHFLLLTKYWDLINLLKIGTYRGFSSRVLKTLDTGLSGPQFKWKAEGQTGECKRGKTQEWGNLGLYQQLF